MQEGVCSTLGHYGEVEKPRCSSWSCSHFWPLRLRQVVGMWSPNQVNSTGDWKAECQMEISDDWRSVHSVKPNCERTVGTQQPSRNCLGQDSFPLFPKVNPHRPGWRVWAAMGCGHGGVPMLPCIYSIDTSPPSPAAGPPSERRRHLVPHTYAQLPGYWLLHELGPRDRKGTHRKMAFSNVNALDKQVMGMCLQNI